MAKRTGKRLGKKATCKRIYADKVAACFKGFDLALPRRGMKKVVMKALEVAFESGYEDGYEEGSGYKRGYERGYKDGVALAPRKTTEKEVLPYEIED